jgi:hypothetical protein
MRTIKTYSKGAPFYNAFIRTWLAERRRTLSEFVPRFGQRIIKSCHFGISFRCHKFLHSLIVARVLAQCPQSDVLVIATQSETTDGMFGVLLAISCKAYGVAGIVIDAGVRDVLESDEDTIPVFSKAIFVAGNCEGDTRTCSRTGRGRFRQ